MLNRKYIKCIGGVTGSQLCENEIMADNREYLQSSCIQ